jgi:hypothetical protein
MPSAESPRDGDVTPAGRGCATVPTLLTGDQVSRKTTVFGVAVAAIVLIQFIPVTRTNPPVEEEIAVPAEVERVLERSCYDCHSFESRWPWYAQVAPASWFVTRHVNEAREHMNFSTWNRYDAEKRADHIEEIGEEVGEGKMPLKSYLLLHRGARLSEADRANIDRWVRTAAPVAGSDTGRPSRDPTP